MITLKSHIDCNSRSDFERQTTASSSFPESFRRSKGRAQEEAVVDSYGESGRGGVPPVKTEASGEQGQCAVDEVSDVEQEAFDWKEFDEVNVVVGKGSRCALSE